MIKLRKLQEGYCIDVAEWNNLRSASDKLKADKGNPTVRQQYFESLKTWLEWVSSHCNDVLKNKKDFDINEVAAVTFVTKIKSEGQYKSFLRMSFVALRDYVTDLLKRIKLELIDQYESMVAVLEADTELLIRNHEMVWHPDKYILQSIGSRKILKPANILDVTYELFYIEQVPTIRDLYQFDLKPYMMFQIRQLLEIVGKNLIGYNNVLDKDGNSIHLFTQVAWTFLHENETNKKKEWTINIPLKFSTIHALNSWSNAFVHKGYFNTCYLQYYALKVVTTLMQPISGKKKDFWGLDRWCLDFGDFEISNYFALKRDFESYVTKRYKRAVVEWKDIQDVGAYLSSYGSPSVLFVMHMPPPVHGASMVGKAIHDSKILNKMFDCHYVNISTAASLADVGRFRMDKLRRFIKMLFTVRQEVKEFKPKLVYVTPNATGSAFYKDFLMVMMLKRMGCRIVAHYHNKGVSRMRHNRIYHWMYSRFFKKIKVILLSELLYSDIKDYVKLTDISICPNGIKNESPDSLPVRKNPCPQILFLSNMLVDKGVFDLLDACKLLKDEGIEFGCTFVGAETKEISADVFADEVSKRGLQEYAQYVGPQYGDDKKKYLQHSDIFVLPTHNECFPLVLLEAMEQALPCVATNEGAIADIVRDGQTGFVVEKHNIIELKDRLKRLIEDADLRKDMGSSGKIYFEEHFTQEHFEWRMANILHRII